MNLECPSCAAPIEAGAEACLACGRSLSILALGSILASRYELRSVLGKGGMGLVYRAFDRLLEEEVAIKVLRTDLVSNAEAVRRFRGEIKLARKVSHPNVCRIHDYGEEGPLGYISMEILSGQDLQKTLKEQPHGLPEKEALSAILQIASGLQAIHDVGILHRDLKTANASRDERGVVRLVDFGIAKDLLAQGQTGTGQAFGTPEYMSPELCRGDTLDFRSDVYALGIVAFEILTGDVPIKAATPMATLFKQIQEMPSFDVEPGSRVPRRLVPVLRRALAKAAADRFASPQEFAQALRLVAMEEPAVISPPPPPGPPVQYKDIRKEERIDLPTDVVLRKLGPGGAPAKEERTVAHDLSRTGMRILTSWSDLEKGDQIDVLEVGGDFATGAIVRNVSRGSDQITRIGIEFLGNRAPDRLVGTNQTQRRGPLGASPTPASPPRHTGPTLRPTSSHSSGHLGADPRPAPPPPLRGSGPNSTPVPPSSPLGSGHTPQAARGAKIRHGRAPRSRGYRGGDRGGKKAGERVENLGSPWLPGQGPGNGGGDPAGHDDSNHGRRDPGQESRLVARVSAESGGPCAVRTRQPGSPCGSWPNLEDGRTDGEGPGRVRARARARPCKSGGERRARRAEGVRFAFSVAFSEPG